MINPSSIATLREALPTPWLIVTDLDGTLLDHRTYSHAPVDNLLRELERKRIPVIFNTSKTFAELVPLRQELGNYHPFVVENGSAIYIPHGYFPRATDAVESHQGYDVVVVGRPATEIHQWLEQIGRQLPSDFISFAQMGVDQLMSATGLDGPAARAASKRLYSEAIEWRGSSEQRGEFCRAAQAAGFNVLQGGRFLHLLGRCDKGRSMHRLREEYQRQWSQPCSLIAAGDSHNDVEMLNSADLAIAIRSPVHAFPRLAADANAICTTEYGPEGWAEIIQPLTDQINVQCPQCPVAGAPRD